MNNKKEKILLAFLPFWTPYIPPQGITILKRFLSHHGYEVKTVDLNIDQKLRNHYDLYFTKLREFIPYEYRGNFVNIGHDVMLNHMLAHVNQTDISKYKELVNIIVYQTYFYNISDKQIDELISILEGMYEMLGKKLHEILIHEKPTIFGATAYSGTLASCMFSYRLVKKHFPHIKTVIGGGSFSDHLVIGTPNFAKFFEKSDYIDKIIIGPGHLLFLRWLEGKLPEEKKVYTADDLNGETIPINESWDLPDLSDLDTSDYLYTAITGSRSCPFSCSFCNVKKFWGQHKTKDAKQIVSEFRTLYNKTGSQLFFCYDALLNSHIDQLSEELINSELSVYYVGYLRVCDEACDIKNTIKWRRGGFYRARLGVESGSQHVLDLMDKRITVKQIKGTIRNLAKAGIKTTVYIVIGHPEETEEDFQASLDLIEELRNDIWEAECNPFNYYYSNQNSSDNWASKRQLVYPEFATDMLIAQTWTLDVDPLRKEVYDRMGRFVRHCDKLGIPNPYSINDIYKADERWKKLQKNAVPSIIELKDPNNYIDECKYVKELVSTQGSMKEDLEFSF